MPLMKDYALTNHNNWNLNSETRSTFQQKIDDLVAFAKLYSEYFEVSFLESPLILVYRVKSLPEAQSQISDFVFEFNELCFDYTKSLTSITGLSSTLIGDVSHQKLEKLFTSTVSNVLRNPGFINILLNSLAHKTALYIDPLNQTPIYLKPISKAYLIVPNFGLGKFIEGILKLIGMGQSIAIETDENVAIKRIYSENPLLYDNQNIISFENILGPEIKNKLTRDAKGYILYHR